MRNTRPIRRGISILGSAALASLVLVAAPLAGNAAPTSSKGVIVENVPLPVDVQDQSLGVQVQNPSLAVTGTVGIAPDANTVQLQGTPTVNVALPQTPRFLDYSLISGENEEAEVIFGTMHVSSITLTNRAENQVGIVVQNVLTSEPACGGAIIGGGTPHLKFELGPRETIHAGFPVPVVFAPLEDDVTCLAVSASDPHAPEVRVGINGFQV